MKPKTTLNHLLILLTVALTSNSAYSWEEEIGYPELLEAYGDTLPVGSNLTLGIVEAKRSNKYGINPNLSYLSQTSISYPYSSGSVAPSSFSGHANEVSRRFASTQSIIPGEHRIVNIETNAWLLNVVRGGSNPPRFLEEDVTNHSWVTNQVVDLYNAMKRVDYMVDEYETFMAAGLNNYSGMTLLLGNNFNTMTVGLKSGKHSLGDTILETTGRTKPDIVVDSPFTSYATPIVSSSAALIISKIKATDSLSDARHTEAVKAILMAGATKSEFKSWSHTPEKPLDPEFGSGELNIKNSYDILVAGQSENDAEINQTLGWDFVANDDNQNPTYLLNASETQSPYINAVLVWHRKIDHGNGSNWNNPTASVENLDLKLWKSNAQGSKIALVWESKSSIDNIEHIYETDLEPDYYLMEVVNKTNPVDFAIAWRSNISPLEVDESNPTTVEETVEVQLSGLIDHADVQVGEAKVLRLTQTGVSGNLQAIQILENDTIVSSSSTAPHDCDWTPSTLGIRNIVGRVITDSGTYDTKISVCVLDDELNPELTSPVAEESFEIGNTITLNASVSTEKGIVASVAFYANNELLGYDSSAPYSLIWTPSSIGNKVIKTIATNGSEKTFESPSNTIRVVSSPISVSLSLSQNNTFTHEAITLNPEFSDNSSALQTIEYYNGSNLLATTSESPYSYSWKPSAPGSYELKAKTITIDGQEFVSAHRTLTVETPVFEKDVISISVNDFAGGIYEVGQIDSFIVSVTGQMSTVESISFFHNDNPVSSDNIAPYRFSFEPQSIGNQRLKVVVKTATSSYTKEFTASAQFAPIPVSLTSPSNELTVFENTTVPIVAEVGATEDAIDSVHFLVNGNVIFTDSNAPYQMSWSPAISGNFELKAVVTNRSNIESASNTVAVIVEKKAEEPGDEDITVELSGLDKTIFLGRSYPFSVTVANASSNIENVAAYIGDALINKKSEAPYEFTFASSTYGDQKIKIVTTTGLGVYESEKTVYVDDAFIKITLETKNQESALKTGETVEVGSSIRKNNATTKSVQLLVNGAAVSQATNSPFGFNWTPATAGTHKLQLKAFNGSDRAFTSNTITFTVEESETEEVDQPSTEPVETVGPISASIRLDNTEIEEGAKLSITAEIEANGATLSNAYLLINGTIHSAKSESPYSWMWTPSQSGIYDLSIKTIDASGTEYVSESQSVTVTEKILQEASIALLANTQSIELGQGILLSTIVEDPDNTVERVDFFNGSTLIATKSSLPASLKWTPSSAGEYTLIATVTSSANLTTESNTLKISVSNPVVEADTIDISLETDHETALVGESISLTTGITGNISAITRVEFFSDDRLIADLQSAPYQLDWTAIEEGNYSIIAKVYTEKGVYEVSKNVTFENDGEILVGLSGIANGTRIIKGEQRSLTCLLEANEASPSKVVLYINGEAIQEDTSAPYEFNWNAAEIGNYEIYATAYNATGEAFKSQTLAAVVEEEQPADNSSLSIDTPNEIRFSNLSDGQLLPFDEIVSLEVEIERPEEIVSVHYYLNNLPIADSYAAPFDAKTIFLADGALTLIAVAVDETGAELISQPIMIEVEASEVENPEPEATQQTFFARDIGETGKTGSTSYTETTGEFKIQAAGRQIWGNRDALRFTYIPMEGDGSITLRVRDLQEVNSWSKAGVMIRSDLSAGSAYAALLLNGAGDVGFQSRQSFQAETKQSSVPFATTGPVYLRISREGKTISSSLSFDGEQWRDIRSKDLFLPETVCVGIALSSNNKNRYSTALFDKVEITGKVILPDSSDTDEVATAAANNLFESQALKTRDIGNVSQVGSTSQNAATLSYTLQATTEDVWGKEDQLRYAYIPVEGNVSVTAKVTSIDRASNWTKAGVMIRASLESDAAQASTFINASGSASFLKRDSQAESTSYTGAFGVEAPAYVRITRRGSLVLSQYSNDGSSWTTIGESEFPIGNAFHAGIALASADSSHTASATFVEVEVKQLD